MPPMSTEPRWTPEICTSCLPPLLIEPPPAKRGSVPFAHLVGFDLAHQWAHVFPSTARKSSRLTAWFLSVSIARNGNPAHQSAPCDPAQPENGQRDFSNSFGPRSRQPSTSTGTRLPPHTSTKPLERTAPPICSHPNTDCTRVQSIFARACIGCPHLSAWPLSSPDQRIQCVQKRNSAASM